MTSEVTSADGVRLRVYESGQAGGPTVVYVHGYPDDHTVWAGVATELAPRYHVVSYDVRGAGESGKPRNRGAYRLDQLAQDLATAVDAGHCDQQHRHRHGWAIPRHRGGRIALAL